MNIKGGGFVAQELDRRVWSIMEQSLWEFDHSPGPRPELWPLIHECLAFIMEHTPEEIISGACQCNLNTKHLLTWIISEGRDCKLADEAKLQALENYCRERHYTDSYYAMSG